MLTYQKFQAANYSSPLEHHAGIDNLPLNFTGYLFLCEVALGRQKVLSEMDYYAHSYLGYYDSVHGLGTYGSDFDG